MSQSAWTKGPVCGVDNCRSRLYRSSAGQMFCQYGHIMEGNIEYDDDDGESYTQTRRLNIQLTDGAFGTTASQSATPAASVVSSATARLYGERGRLQHLKCLQHILRMVLPRVVSHLYQLPPPELHAYRCSLATVAKLLWSRCVAACKTKPTVLDVYVIIYLAMVQLNQLPVFVDQYLAMLKRNHVPFFDATALVPPAMLSVAPVATLSLTSSTFVPLNDMFYKSLTSWKTTLDLPHLAEARSEAFLPLVYKLYADLRLPDPPRLVCVFHEYSILARNGVLRAAGPQSQPEIQAVSLALEVLRLYFFGGDEVPDPQTWMAENQSQTMACFDRPYHSMSVSEVMKLSDADVASYCRWVYDTLVPAKHKDPEETQLSTVERQLNRIFAYSNEEPTQKEHVTRPIPTTTAKLSETARAEIENFLFDTFAARFGLTKKTLAAAVKGWERDMFAKKIACAKPRRP